MAPIMEKRGDKTKAAEYLRRAEAMKKAGWLAVKNGSLVFPNFDRHNGSTAKTRACGNNRVKRFRNAATVTNPLPEKRREEKIKEEPPKPPLIGSKPPTIDQAISAGSGFGVTEAACREWWNSRESTGWTIASGGTVRAITNWQTDLSRSKGWAEDQAKKNKKSDWKDRL
jgi:hypothetical protein